jgi:hypothetical protein
MPVYCIYTLLDCNTIASTPSELECASDKEAIEEANALLYRHDVEVWQGPRIVIRLKPKPTEANGQPRKAPRRLTLKSGTIILGKKAHLPCSVRNLSETGACLEVQATLKSLSTFLFGMPGRPPRTCKVIWRDDRQLGVHFR